MSARGVSVLIGVVVGVGVVVGAIVGGAVGHANGGGQVLLETAIVGVSGAVVGGGIVLLLLGAVQAVRWHHWTWLDALEVLVGVLGECGLPSAVLVVASVVTIAGFLLWHSLLLAALAGGSIVIVMLIGLSVVAALYKAGSQSS